MPDKLSALFGGLKREDDCTKDKVGKLHTDAGGRGYGVCDCDAAGIGRRGFTAVAGRCGHGDAKQQRQGEQPLPAANQHRAALKWLRRNQSANRGVER